MYKRQIYSQDHCLNGKDSVRIADGTFNLSCDEDGIHAGNDDQQDGYVYIEGGDINISVGDDALHAAVSYTHLDVYKRQVGNRVNCGKTKAL